MPEVDADALGRIRRAAVGGDLRVDRGRRRHRRLAVEPGVVPAADLAQRALPRAVPAAALLAGVIERGGHRDRGAEHDRDDRDPHPRAPARRAAPAAAAAAGLRSLLEHRVRAHSSGPSGGLSSAPTTPKPNSASTSAEITTRMSTPWRTAVRTVSAPSSRMNVSAAMR